VQQGLGCFTIAFWGGLHCDVRTLLGTKEVQIDKEVFKQQFA